MRVEQGLYWERTLFDRQQETREGRKEKPGDFLTISCFSRTTLKRFWRWTSNKGLISTRLKVSSVPKLKWPTNKVTIKSTKLVKAGKTCVFLSFSFGLFTSLFLLLLFFTSFSFIFHLFFLVECVSRSPGGEGWRDKKWRHL